jgi:hypothetical protein
LFLLLPLPLPFLFVIPLSLPKGNLRLLLLLPVLRRHPEREARRIPVLASALAIASEIGPGFSPDITISHKSGALAPESIPLTTNLRVAHSCASPELVEGCA